MFLTDREVACRFSVSRQTVWRWVREGNFPAPVKLTPGCTRWGVAEIEAWAHALQEGELQAAG